MIVYSISELNEYLGPKCLRMYQNLIANSIDFSINIDESVYKFYRSYTSDDQNILIFLSNDLLTESNYFQLQSSQAGTGYELENKFLELNSAPVEFTEEYIDIPLIVVGHWNFAHFIWNQFPALYFLMRQVCGANLVSIRSCLIDLEIAFPDIKICDKKSILSYKNSLFLGGQHLNSDAHVFLFNLINNKLIPIDKVSQNVYYLGIRGEGVRSLENETEFYDLLIQEVLKVQPNVIFYVDGFSYATADTLNPGFIERANKIDKKINTFVVKYGSNIIVNINGIHILDALSYIKNIDFYITHEGTMQHKIGWVFLEKKGLILTKSKFASAVALWHQSQVSGALQPSFLSIESYEYTDSSRDANFSLIDPRRSAIEALGFILNS
jgi:hypothetical protein